MNIRILIFDQVRPLGERLLSPKFCIQNRYLLLVILYTNAFGLHAKYMRKFPRVGTPWLTFIKTITL